MPSPIPQKPLAPLAGSGKGLWGRDSARTLRRLREEWNRQSTPRAGARRPR